MAKIDRSKGDKSRQRTAVKDPKDLARQRALNRALLRAPDGRGPLIVRIVDGPASAGLAPADHKPKLAAKSTPSRVAGIVPKQGSRKPARKKTKAKKGIKPAPKQLTPEQQAKKAEEAKRAREAARIRLQRRLATMQAAVESDIAYRETRKREEIEAFLAKIGQAPFETLISVWKKHVTLLAHIQATGRNKARAPLYEDLLRQIEEEWEVRSRLPDTVKGYFKWPTTEAKRGKGDMGAPDWTPEGVLSYVGYHVGETSKMTPESRWAILARVFNGHLPPVNGPSYMQEWGSPGSPKRLRKMAESIASFSRSAKRRTSVNLRVAISAWEADLARLHKQFYVGKFGFGWPRV